MSKITIAEMIAVSALAVGDESMVWKKFFLDSATPLAAVEGVLAVTNAVPVVSYTVTTGMPLASVMTGLATIDVTATRVLLDVPDERTRVVAVVVTVTVE